MLLPQLPPLQPPLLTAGTTGAGAGTGTTGAPLLPPQSPLLQLLLAAGTLPQSPLLQLLLAAGTLPQSPLLQPLLLLLTAGTTGAGAGAGATGALYDGDEPQLPVLQPPLLLPPQLPELQSCEDALPYPPPLLPLLP